MSDEKVGGLVAKWREAAKQADAAQGKVTKYGCAYAVVFRDCADELEAALSAHGQPVVDEAAIRTAMNKAFGLGQTYWSQADSESVAVNKRSDATLQKFRALIDETCAALTGDTP